MIDLKLEYATACVRRAPPIGADEMRPANPPSPTVTRPRLSNRMSEGSDVPRRTAHVQSVVPATTQAVGDVRRLVLLFFYNGIKTPVCSLQD